MKMEVVQKELYKKELTFHIRTKGTELVSPEGNLAGPRRPQLEYS